MSSSQRVDRVLVSGSFWTSVGEVSGALADLVTSIVAARVLELRDFGLFGAAMLVLAILDQFSQTGFESALVQKSDDPKSFLNVTFTWHLLRGLLMSGILLVAAPLVSRWYDEPALFSLLLCLSLAPLINGIRNVGTVYFTRQLDFRTIFLIKISQTLLRLVVFLPAVLYFRNVWALVISQLMGAIVGVVISYVAHPYRPRLEWDREKLRELVAYGKWLTGLAWLIFVITQGDDIFVSKYLGIVALGVYQYAYKLSNTPATAITHVVGGIAMPMYSRLQDAPEERKAAFIKVMRLTLFLAGPVSVFIYFAVPDVVAFVIGEKWAPAIPLVRILVLGGVVRSFAALAGPVFAATGRPDFDFKMNLPRFFCIVIGLYPAARFGGLEGVSWLVLAAIMCCLPTWFYGLKRLIGITPREVLKHNVLAILGSLLLAGSYYAVRKPIGSETVWSAAVGTLAWVGAWLAALWLLGRLTPWDMVGELQRLRATLKNKA
ncbi:MAG: lipopolysaccharide biosynthesis protein [Myxococcales bacterium]|nr:lipopolysaccharide biosynthesis protein [Myxococcales bacterium]